MKKRGQEIKKIWDEIPLDVDILITHGPPYGHGDTVPYIGSTRQVGCLELLKAIQVAKPKIHIFGHVHESYGISESEEMETLFVNASICNKDFRPLNRPVELTL